MHATNFPVQLQNRDSVNVTMRSTASCRAWLSRAATPRKAQQSELPLRRRNCFATWTEVQINTGHLAQSLKVIVPLCRDAARSRFLQVGSSLARRAAPNASLPTARVVGLRRTQIENSGPSGAVSTTARPSFSHQAGTWRGPATHLDFPSRPFSAASKDAIRATFLCGRVHGSCSEKSLRVPNVL